MSRMDCRTQLASMAIEELDRGDFSMAIKILTTSIRLEPNNHELFFERSICHHKLGDFQASLDDANTAIRLNSSDYNIYYQKGLALIGLSLFPEAVASFKKAIELRAKQEDSKLSDIFKLLRDATNELNSARKRPGTTAGQTRTETGTATTTAPLKPATATATTTKTATALASEPNTSNNEPVDSTTDKPISRAVGQQLIATDHQSNAVQIDAVIKNHNQINHGNINNSNSNSNNLVATSNRNNQASCTEQVLNNNSIATSGRVSSSASQFNPNNTIGEQQTSSSLTLNVSSPNNHTTIRDTRTPDDHRSEPKLSTDQQHDQSKSSMSTSSFEWNIRRSERIFLHNTNEPGGASANEMPRQHDNNLNGEFVLQRHRTNSNPSSIGSSKGANKRSLDQRNDIRPSYQPAARATKSKTGTNSHVDSDIDVGDNNYANSAQPYSFNPKSGDKRVMVVPSSSMPATSNAATAGATKEDSYSSKYKRLRRDRERARRGTSKLCTIKLSDLEELHKGSKRFMRVIAPIDGWLYSGQLSVDSRPDSGGSPQYVVKLDGDSSDSSYLFTQSTVLNDVIKEVRVKSVSELRKGARICCYWSRTYKCLSTGVVTSRTFEATKSLVSVKYDNGDLSALQLEDLRLLPPDYPKYMSNCDPLLLATNGDSAPNTQASASSNETSRVVVNGKSSNFNSGATYSKAIVDAIIKKCDETDLANNDGGSVKSSINAKKAFDTNDSERDHHLKEVSKCATIAEDETIPPTNETIEFLTSETSPERQTQHIGSDLIDSQDIVANGNVATINGSQIITSRASSEENNYSIEYQPWRFEGAPKRTKRNGRTYRDNYVALRRGDEVLRVGDSAELMPRDESILPFIAKIDGIWANSRGEMRVRVRWYYRLVETEGEPCDLEDGENALFETDHFDENDVQSIWRSTKILPWTEYARNHLGHVNKSSDGPKIFYLAGYYDPVRRVKHLRADVKAS